MTIRRMIFASLWLVPVAALLIYRFAIRPILNWIQGMV
jgi:hypothetical protein